MLANVRLPPEAAERYPRQFSADSGSGVLAPERDGLGSAATADHRLHVLSFRHDRARESGGRRGGLPAPRGASIVEGITPHRSALKAEVGVRKLHNYLSRYVRHLAKG